MSDDALKRKIKFYGLKCSKFPIFNNASGIGYLIKEKLPPGRFPLPKNENIIISIIDSNESHSFGSIGKVKSVVDSPFTRQVDEDTREPIPEDNLDNVHIEEFTYFYVDYSSNRAAELFSNEAPSFKRYLPILIKHRIPKIEDFIFIPEKVEDLNNKLKHTIELAELSFAFMPSNNYKGTPSISDLYGISSDNVSDVKVKLTFHEKIADDQFLIQLENLSQKNCSSIKVKAIDEDDSEILIDVMTKILTKNSKIELSPGDDSDHQKIKNELIISLAHTANGLFTNSF